MAKNVDLETKAKRFCALHEGPDTFVIPNPWDRGSARLFAGLGFKALATTSSGFAYSQGLSDGSVDREQVLAHIKELNEATDLPVSADLENCFADDAAAAAETIRLAGEAGAVGGSIEDCTGPEEARIYEIPHAVERVVAAVEAARSLPFKFVLTARAENLIRGRPDLADTIERLQAFEEAGADVLYAPGLKTAEEVRQVCDAVSKPVNVLAHSGLSVTEITEAGGKRISIGGALARVTVGSILNAAKEMQQDGTFSSFADAPTFPEINALLRQQGRGPAVD